VTYTVINLYRNKNPFRLAKEPAQHMPSVVVVPVYIEVSSGFERAVDTLESYLRRAGYAFHTGKPMTEDLEEIKTRLGEHIQEAANENPGGRALST